MRAVDGGVLVRAGQTEASVDLSRLAGLNPSGVICEIMNEDGTMARVPQLREFCARHGLKLISVADLIRHRLRHERYVHRRAEGSIATEFGEFRSILYTSDISPESHLALIHGEVAGREKVLVRMHSHCAYGNLFGSTRCDCQAVVRGSLKRIVEAGKRACSSICIRPDSGCTPGDGKLIPATTATLHRRPRSTKSASGRRFFSDLGLSHHSAC